MTIVPPKSSRKWSIRRRKSHHRATTIKTITGEGSLKSSDAGYQSNYRPAIMKPVHDTGFVVLRIMKLRRCNNIARVLLFLLTAVTFSIQAAGRSYHPTNPALVARAEQVTGDRFAVVTTTPEGVTVFARTMPRADLLNA